MAEIRSEAEKHHLIAGVLCLNFANTLYGHGKTPIHEYLAGYPDLVVWSRRAGLLTDLDARLLLRESARRPAETSAVFHHAIAFRETIYRFFAALAHDELPKAADLASLNVARAESLAHSRIRRTSADYAIDWDSQTALDAMLWPIALSAADLLTQMDVSRVRQCSGCDWLFLRYQPQPSPPLVLDERLRQPREGAPLQRAQAQTGTETQMIGIRCFLIR